MSDKGDTIRVIFGVIAVTVVACVLLIVLTVNNGEDPDPRIRCLDHHSYGDCAGIINAPTEEPHGD